MRQIVPHTLWLGNAGDMQNPRRFLDADIRAVVDLAANEPFPQLPRHLIYCRFPLIEGGGNDPTFLRLAIRTVTELVTGMVPTAICCSNGLSRSPAIAAAGLSIAMSISLHDALLQIAASGKHDVDPALWNEINVVCEG
jgi:hypothetical protein